MLYEIYPSERLLALFNVFEEARGEINYVLVGGLFPEEFTSSYTFHKATAAFTIEAVTTRPRYLRFSEKGPTSRREPEKAEGIEITLSQVF